MAGIGFAPYRSMDAENIRDLQRRTRQARCALGRRPVLVELAGDVLKRTRDLADRLGGDLEIECRALELGMTEQHLDHADVDLLLMQMRRESG